jgi:threonine/homoserine/homoserine lactone efflux protein
VLVSREFLATAFVVALVPGTGVLYTVSAGLFVGRRASAWAAVGGTVGVVPHLLAAVLGLSALLQTSAEVFSVLKLLGVAYLLFLAWGMWRDTGVISLRAPDQTERSGREIVLRGTLVNLLNPKLTIFFFAFLPQFLRPGSSTTLQMLELGGVFMLVTLVVFLVYGELAGVFRARVVESPMILRRLQPSAAAVFALLAVRLATEDR